MKQYVIEAPAIVRVTMVVEADSKEEAMKKVMMSPLEMDLKLTDDQDYSDYNLDDYVSVDYEWQMHDRVVQGNIYYGGINEMEVVEVIED